jgi:hypothetical protein
MNTLGYKRKKINWYEYFYWIKVKWEDEIVKAWLKSDLLT